MKRIIFITLVLIYSINVFSINLPIDSIPNIVIDSIIFYDDPFVITEDKIESKGNSPVWIKGFCSTSLPTFFDLDAKKGIKYIHSSIAATEIDLQDFYNKWKPNDKLTRYMLGDIYFHDNKTNKRYIWTISWAMLNNNSVRLSNLDLSKFRNRNCENDKYELFYKNDYSSFYFYVKENGVYKKCNDLYLFEVLNWDIRSKGGTFKSGRKFIEFVSRQKKYIRSRIVNSKRIFETVKNTPNGKVVVPIKNKNINKVTLQREKDYKWYIVVGLFLILGLLLILRKRRK